MASKLEYYKRSTFDERIRVKLGDSMTKVDDGAPTTDIRYLDVIDFMNETDVSDIEDPIVFAEDPIDKDDIANDEEYSNIMVNEQLQLISDENLKYGKVITRSVNNDGNLIQDYNNNILLNTLL